GRAGRAYACASGLLVGLYLGPQVAAIVISSATVVYLVTATLALQILALRKLTWTLALFGTLFGYAVSPHWWEKPLAVSKSSPGGFVLHMLLAVAVTAAAAWGAARASTACPMDSK